MSAALNQLFPHLLLAPRTAGWSSSHRSLCFSVSLASVRTIIEPWRSPAARYDRARSTQHCCRRCQKALVFPHKAGGPRRQVLLSRAIDTSASLRGLRIPSFSPDNKMMTIMTCVCLGCTSWAEGTHVGLVLRWSMPVPWQRSRSRSTFSRSGPKLAEIRPYNGPKLAECLHVVEMARVWSTPLQPWPQLPQTCVNPARIRLERT